MKLPDRDSVTILYSLIGFAAVTSFCLLEFAGVPILRSIWVTIPSFLFVGYIALRRFDRALDESIRRVKNPLQVSMVPGLGELRQFADRWEVELAIPLSGSGILRQPITIDAPSDGPTEKQLELVRKLPRKCEVIESHIHEKLRQYFAEMDMPEEYDKVNFKSMSAHVCFPEEDDDLEIWYSALEEHSDMFYSVCLMDWKVSDVYSGD